MEPGIPSLAAASDGPDTRIGPPTGLVSVISCGRSLTCGALRADDDGAVYGVEVVEHPIVSNTQLPAERLVSEPFSVGVGEGITCEHPERVAYGVAVVGGQPIEVLFGRWVEVHRPRHGVSHTRRG